MALLNLGQVITTNIITESDELYKKRVFKKHLNSMMHANG